MRRVDPRAGVGQNGDNRRSLEPSPGSSMPISAHDATAVATLQERVGTLSGDINDLRRATNELDHKIDSIITNFGARFDQSFTALNTKLDTSIQAISTKFETSITSTNTKIEERARIPWPAWTVVVSALGLIGALAYWPIMSEQTHLAANQTAVQAEIDRVTDRMVPRGEHEEKWRSYDAQNADLKSQIATDVSNLQRQIDETNRRVGDTYSARDEILSERDRINTLDKEISELSAKLH